MINIAVGTKHFSKTLKTVYNMETYLLTLKSVTTNVINKCKTALVHNHEDYICFLIDLFIMHNDLKLSEESFENQVDIIFQKCCAYLEGRGIAKKRFIIHSFMILDF